MLLVPRSAANANSRDGSVSVSINAVGFSGSLFVKNEEQFNFLVKQGPMSLLESVTFPAETATS
jgi:ATP adenylyltransferase